MRVHICNGPIIPGTVYYSKATEGKYPFDPAKAKALLQEAKWDPNYTLQVMVPTGNQARELSADIVQQNLQDIGIKLSIQKMEFATLRTKQKEDTWDLSFIGWGGPLDPDVSSQYKTGGQYNNGSWSLKQMDDLLDKGVVTADPAARKTIYNDFQDLFVDQLPIIPLYWANRTVAVNKRVHERQAHGRHQQYPAQHPRVVGNGRQVTGIAEAAPSVASGPAGHAAGRHKGPPGVGARPAASD